MKSPFESAEDDDFTDVEFTLDVRCVGDETLDVTSNDLTLDQAHPDICPVGYAATDGDARGILIVKLRKNQVTVARVLLMEH